MDCPRLSGPLPAEPGERPARASTGRAAPSRRRRGQAGLRVTGRAPLVLPAFASALLHPAGLVLVLNGGRGLPTEEAPHCCCDLFESVVHPHRRCTKQTSPKPSVRLSHLAARLPGARLTFDCMRDELCGCSPDTRKRQHRCRRVRVLGSFSARSGLRVRSWLGLFGARRRARLAVQQASELYASVEHAALLRD